MADRNVLGYIEGADPKLKDEVVIVSAHYDHEGADGATIFNGADDDGSGTVALLEIAEAYAMAAEASQRPRRSVLFACWGSEERGPLLGSWAYTEAPTFPLERTVAVLNMDMVGRNEEVPVGGGPRFNGLEVQTAESNRNAMNILGYSRHPELSALVERVNSRLRARAEDALRQQQLQSVAPQRSVAVPSERRARAVVPHRPSPRLPHAVRPARGINYEKMEKIARLVHQVSWVLANQDTRPK